MPATTTNTHPRYTYVVPAVLAGLMYRLAFLPFAWWPLGWVCLVPLFVVVRRVRPMSALAAGCLFGATWACLHARGIHYAASTFFRMPWYQAACAALLATPAYSALWSALMVGTFLLLHRTLRCAPVPALVASWFLRDLLLSRFGPLPWNMLGSSQAPAPLLLQTADLGGAPVTGAVLALANAFLAEAWLQRHGKWRRPVISMGAVVLVACLYGAIRIRQVEAAGLERRGEVVVALVQPNFRHSVEVFDSRDRQRRLRRLTEEAFALGADIAVLPEGMGGDPQARIHWRGLLRPGQWLVAGADSEREAEHGVLVRENVAVFIDGPGDPAATYVKRRLYPLSEAPVWGLERLLVGHMRRKDYNWSQPGPREPAVFSGAGWRTTPLICFEVLFHDVVAQSAARHVDWLTVISNDEWFDTTSEGLQHQAQVAVVAILARRPVVRVTNTGVSGAFDAVGRPLPVERYLWPDEEREVNGTRYRLPISVPAALAGGTSPVRHAGAGVLPRLHAGIGLARIPLLESAPSVRANASPWILAALLVWSWAARRKR